VYPPSSISSASHPKTNSAVAAIRKAPSSRITLFTFSGFSMSLDLVGLGMLPFLAPLVDAAELPENHAPGKGPKVGGANCALMEE
jgi:hypothetical protein